MHRRQTAAGRGGGAFANATGQQRETIRRGDAQQCQNSVHRTRTGRLQIGSQRSLLAHQCYAQSFAVAHRRHPQKGPASGQRKWFAENRKGCNSRTSWWTEAGKGFSAFIECPGVDLKIKIFFIFLTQQIAALTKTSTDLQSTVKNNRESFYKVQRKLRLVVSERDCYKQLIENYEKNVTSKWQLHATNCTPHSFDWPNPFVSNPVSGAETTVSDINVRLRMEMLEKTVAGYKEMCASLEKDLQSVKSSPDHGNENARNDDLSRWTN